jgi:signal transduction histidine kinase
MVYTLGAIAFCVLTAFYLREYRRRSSAQSRTALPFFTLVCATAFLSNLLSQEGILQSASLVMVRNLAAGLIPPLMLHLIYEAEACRIKAAPWWRRILAGFYLTGAACGVARGLTETGWFLTAAGDALDEGPAALLGAAAVMGLLLQSTSGSPLRPSDRTHRRRMLAVLVLILLCAVAALAGMGMAAQLPDYLLLIFFGLTLYHSERLVFIDLLVRGGTYLAMGIALLACCFAAGMLFSDPLPAGPYYAMTLFVLAFWLLGPWVYARVSRIVDRQLLSRPYSPLDAERRFLHEIQVAADEDELRSRTSRSLGSIFQSEAEVRFGPPFLPAGAEGRSNGPGVAVALEQNREPLGVVTLAERPSGIPYLSDDLRLLQSLSGALCLSLENVRHRVDRRLQAEREQQLKLLATRSELKALRAQINPHFLFNTLSVIAGLMHSQPELADETIEHLAQVFRYTLRKSENEWAQLAEEVDFVSAYLRIEQARFGERLTVKYEVDRAALQVPIPAMSIQPLIENAVRHGVSAIEGPGAVGLKAVVENELLRLEVYDNGPGFPKEFCLDRAEGGHGLRNVMDRLQGYYGASARLFWASSREGTRVVLTFPAGTRWSRREEGGE